jgi:signal transduction protein with GAF and PtsI domain
MLRDDRTTAFLLSAYRHLPPAWAKKINQPLDDGLSSLVALSGQPLTIHGPAMEKFKVAGLGRSAAVLPIKIQDELLGVLLVVRKADRDFDREIQALLETVAGLVAISVANARLFQTVEAMAQAARLKEKSHNAAVESVRATIRDEVRVCMYPLETLISGEVGALSQGQREAVTTIQTALKRLARSADKGAGADGAGSS